MSIVVHDARPPLPATLPATISTSCWQKDLVVLFYFDWVDAIGRGTGLISIGAGIIIVAFDTPIITEQRTNNCADPFPPSRERNTVGPFYT